MTESMIWSASCLVFWGPLEDPDLASRTAISAVSTVTCALDDHGFKFHFASNVSEVAFYGSEFLTGAFRVHRGSENNMHANYIDERKFKELVPMHDDW